MSGCLRRFYIYYGGGVPARLRRIPRSFLPHSWRHTGCRDFSICGYADIVPPALLVPRVAARTTHTSFLFDNFPTVRRGNVQKSPAAYAVLSGVREAIPAFIDELLPFSMRELEAYIRQHPRDYLAYSTLGGFITSGFFVRQKDEQIERMLAQAQTLAPKRLGDAFGACTAH